jgi:Uma2 family endonuclease
MSDMAAELTLHKITVAQFHRMAEAGILEERERVELLDGLLVDMSPVGPPHKALHAEITRYLNGVLGARASVGPGFSIPLGDFNEPLPDIVILAPRGNEYFRREPAPDEILAVVEVADSSLKKDTGFKRDLYAQFGIPDYLVADTSNRVLLRYAEPVNGEYNWVERMTDGSTFALAALPEITLRADPFLVPADLCT